MKKLAEYSIVLIIASLLVFFFLNKCSTDKQGPRLIKSDTTEYITKIDSLEKVIEAKADFIDPKSIDSAELEPEIITKYITTSKDCDKPHLTDAGIELVKHRRYKDTKQVDGFYLSYDASVIGELQSINLGIEGNYYQKEINTVKTIKNNYIKPTNQIYVTASYNQSLRVGVMFQNDRFHYGLSRDLGTNTWGGSVAYTVFRF